MITFIVPAFNAGGTIRRTLESLFDQTSSEWRAIVVDDESTDDTRRIVAGLHSRRISVIWRENGGLAAARNTGLAACRTDLVSFLDADDLVEPSFVERMSDVLGNSTHDGAACWVRMLGAAGEELDWVVPLAPADCTSDVLTRYNPLAVGAVVIRREALKRIGTPQGRVFEESLPCVEDWDLWLRLTAAGFCWAPIVNEPLFGYRMTDGAMNRNIERMWRTGRTVLARNRVSDTREWDLRSLARAIAAGDLSLIQTLRVAVGQLAEGDVGVLVGAIQWAFCQHHRIGPAHAWRFEQEWRARTADALCHSDVEHRVAARVSWMRDRWEHIAREASRRALGGRVVVYGVGRNGMALAAALAAIPPGRRGHSGIAWIDDHADRSPVAELAPESRLTATDLRPDDLVVVTPEQRDTLMERLEAMGVARIETPSTLCGAQAA